MYHEENKKRYAWPSNVPLGPVTAKIKRLRTTVKAVDRKQKAYPNKMINHLLRR